MLGARASSPAFPEARMLQVKMLLNFLRQVRKVRTRTPALPAFSRSFHLPTNIPAVFLLLGLLCQSMAFTTGAPSIIPAFPGAEGFGASTPGGRGGKVIAVTNLSDEGPGSFRAA